jgi:hypothetical protein
MRYLFLYLLAAASLAVMSAAARAEEPEAQAPSQPRFPCQDDPRAREFDFWAGEFRVQDAQGNLLGHNTIRKAQGDCTLIEDWTGAKGGTGTSLNFYDPARGQWRQLWVSPGTIIDIAGGLVDGSMVLEGTVYYQASGETRPFRGTWTPMSGGVVRQFFEESTDGGATFVPWFEGFYHPIPKPGPAG